VVWVNEPLYACKNGSLPTATYLQQRINKLLAFEF
jgi:hypothetical protein